MELAKQHLSKTKQPKEVSMKRLTSLLAMALLLALATGATAQVTKEWVARYNGPANGHDAGSAIAVDASGNVYVTGHSVGSGTSLDYVTVKYNSSGVQQWARRYNGPVDEYDRASAIAVDDEGNVYVTGWSPGSGTWNDYTTIKYDSSGVQQWVARYNGPGNSGDNAYSIALDDAGNVYVTGTSAKYRTTPYNYDYVTVKYNSSGIQQWARRYNGPGDGDDRANSLAVDDEGNVYVTGYSKGSGTDNDCATIKYNSSGVQQR
ncbi:hypothetical protein GH141_04445, partial [bacterium]|nr:hypothetical protein [bacterium]